MMLPSVFIAGFLIGSMLYIPIGPNGLIALTTIKSASYKGLIGTAIGSSLASFLTAIFSILLVLNFPVVSLNENLIGSLSSIFLIIFGIFFVTKSVLMPPSKKSKVDMLKYIRVSFFVGISNPKNLIIFPTLLFSFYPSLNNMGTSHENILLLAFGAFLSAVAWWCVFYFSLRLVDIVRFPKIIETVSHAFGIILVIVGIIRLIIPL